MQWFKAITAVMAFLLAAAAAGSQQEGADTATATTPTHKVYLSLADQFGVPKTEPLTSFDCSDKIYIVAELNDFPAGKRQLSVEWIDPHQTTRETTQYPFFVRTSSTRVWAWLSLSRGAGAGILQWIDPAAGLEEFIGEWVVDLRVDGQLLGNKRFEVNC